MEKFYTIYTDYNFEVGNETKLEN